MKEAQKNLLNDLAALLEKHRVVIDMSKTYTDGICFELDCGGAWVCLPNQETITAQKLKEMAQG